MLVFVLYAWAQDRTVSGKVTDAETGEALPGVNVLLKSSGQGVVTDIDGNYKISVPSDGGTLVFTFIGMKRIEKAIGSQSVVDIQMSSDIQQLTEVVVTASSIERERKELGYSITSVAGDEVTKARDQNIVNSLAGRVPGVQITSSGGSVGSSSSILIRGASSLTGDNQPLFVVDGVPIFNSNISSGSRITGTVDTGNRAGDINPDDVESISVLKSAAAAALYGQRAKNGAIIITTKRGKNGRGKVSLNSSVRFDNALKLPDYQNTYAQGSLGKYDSESLNGWGPEINGQEVVNILEDTVTLQAFPDNVRDFYETGVTAINSISFSNGNETSDFRLGLTNLESSGITPNSNLTRNTIAINGGTKVTDKLTARTSLNYIRTTSLGRPAQGGNDPTILTSIVTTAPRTFDLSGELSDYKNEDGTQKVFGNFTNNPYWVAFENPFETELDRIFGNVQLEYEIMPYLKLMGRAGIDTYDEYRRRIYVKGTVGRENGQFSEDIFKRSQLNTELFLTFDKDLSEDISLRALVGHNFNQITARNLGVFAQELTAEGVYSYGNAAATTPDNNYSQRRLYGVFSDVTLGFRDYLFLNLTARNDWSSTLPEESNSFFYPSANLSFVFTQAFDIANDILSFGKVRANIAQVGSDEAPYQLNFRYFPLTSIFGQYSTGNQFPYGGQTGYSATSVIPPTNLKPQIQTQYEIGGEFQFFNGRLGVDFTYYDIVTSDQIISIPVPESTGFTSRRINVGQTSNSGIELLVSGDILKSNDFTWNLTANFAQNKNVVDELAEGVEEIVIQSAFNGLQVRAVPGETLGLYGVGFARDSVSGQVIIDEETGLRQSGDQERFGNIYPDFTLGLQNTFTYKGLSIGALFDWRQGGVLFSQTVKSVRSAGVAIETAENREGVFIDNGVIEQEDGSFVPNNVPVQSMQAFWQRYNEGSIIEGGVFDASYVKLREVSVNYSLPSKWFDSMPISSLSVGVEGRNLAILFSKIPHIDPETNLFGSGSNGAAVEWNNVPSVRSFGGNVRITF